LFLYRYVLNREIGDLDEVIRARRPRRLPVVMTREETKAVISQLKGSKWIAACLMYGAGLRLLECLRLRVQDIGFSANQITVRDGKGNKDRLTMLPEAVKRPLSRHLERIREVHKRDLTEGYGRVQMPYALERKYPGAVVERTNNILEPFFDQEKRHLRRRLGKAHLGRDLEDQPAQAFLAANLRHDDYVRVLCGSLDNLAAAFADLDQKALAEATPLARENRDSDLRRRVRALLKRKAVPAGPVQQAANAPEIGPAATVV